MRVWEREFRKEHGAGTCTDADVDVDAMTDHRNSTCGTYMLMHRLRNKIPSTRSHLRHYEIRFDVFSSHFDAQVRSGWPSGVSRSHQLPDESAVPPDALSASSGWRHSLPRADGEEVLSPGGCTFRSSSGTTLFSPVPPCGGAGQPRPPGRRRLNRESPDMPRKRNGVRGLRSIPAITRRRGNRKDRRREARKAHRWAACHPPPQGAGHLAYRNTGHCCMDPVNPNAKGRYGDNTSGHYQHHGTYGSGQTANSRGIHGKE